jgi:hypothetical protein
MHLTSPHCADSRELRGVGGGSEVELAVARVHRDALDWLDP